MRSKRLKHAMFTAHLRLSGNCWKPPHQRTGGITVAATAAGARVHVDKTHRALALFVVAASFAASLAPAAADEFCVDCVEPTAQYICQTNFGGSRIATAGARLLCISQIAKRYGHQTCKAGRPEKQARCLGKIVVLTREDLANSLAAGTLRPPKALPPTHGTIAGGTAPGAPAPSNDDPETKHERTQRSAPLDSRPSDHRPGAIPEADPDKRSLQRQTEAKPNDGPPRTVEELARRATESSKENLNKAGDAVKQAGEAVTGAVKKTWECLSSLLSDC